MLHKNQEINARVFTAVFVSKKLERMKNKGTEP